MRTGRVSGACQTCHLFHPGCTWRLGLVEPLGGCGPTRTPEGSLDTKPPSGGPGRGRGGEAFSLLSAEQPPESPLDRARMTQLPRTASAR